MTREERRQNVEAIRAAQEAMAGKGEYSKVTNPIKVLLDEIDDLNQTVAKLKTALAALTGSH